MRLGRAGLLAAAVSFARSPQGRRLISQARQKMDTPQNRAKLQQMRQSRGRRPV